MKRQLLLFIVLCTTLSAVAQQSLPYISRNKKDGKFGYIHNGKTLLPHIFEDARSFLEGEALTHVSFGKEHFLIDRKGDMVTNKGYKLPPRIYPRFAIVDWEVKSGLDSESGIAVNSRGQRLFPNLYAAALSTSDLCLFAVSKDKGEYNAQLATIDGKIINKNLRGKFSLSETGIIKYTDNSPDHNMGVINAWGEVLIPCKYRDIQFCYLDKMHYKIIKKLKKAGVMDKYSPDMQSKIGVIVATEALQVTVYDQCGNILVPAKHYKSLYHTDVINKNLKKAIIPHFLRRGEVMKNYVDKIGNPYTSRKYEYLESVSKLPLYSSSGKSIKAHIAYLQEHPNYSLYTLAECYTKGMALYNNQKCQEAIPWLLRAAEGKHLPAYRRLADSYNNSKQFQKAHIWYKNCVKELTPGSNDYWFACMILGGMYKAGRGCEKNYDTSLYYLRLFHQHTTTINKPTANEMIAEVLALKNKTTTKPQQSASRGSSSSNSSSQHSQYTPAPNTMPNDVNRYICYKNRAGRIAGIRTYIHNGEWKASVYAQGNAGSGNVYIFIRQYVDDTKWVYKGGVPNLLSNTPNTNIDMHIALNWSYIKVNGVVYDIPISKQEYDKIMPKGNVYINNGGGYNNSGSSNYNSNDSGRSYIDGPCKYCGGGGGCSSCNGRGYKYNPYSGHNDTCPSCNGSGRCFNCRGTGKQATY